ncbi:hypothetical protein PJJ91_29040, partial [Mycobacterium kansasii]
PKCSSLNFDEVSSLSLSKILFLFLKIGLELENERISSLGVKWGIYTPFCSKNLGPAEGNPAPESYPGLNPVLDPSLDKVRILTAKM